MNSLGDKAMSTRELDRETYRRIIESYFRAFGTGDFSHVQFSSQVQFLSPLSDATVSGSEAVSKFVSGISSRVSAVDIMSTAVDFPTASGVWQMTTTKGVQYTRCTTSFAWTARDSRTSGPCMTPRPSSMTLRAWFSGLQVTATSQPCRKRRLWHDAPAIEEHGQTEGVVAVAVRAVDRGEPALVQRHPVGDRRGLADGHPRIHEYRITGTGDRRPPPTRRWRGQTLSGWTKDQVGERGPCGRSLHGEAAVDAPVITRSVTDVLR